MLTFDGWTIQMYHRHVRVSKLARPAPRYRTATIARQAAIVAGSNQTIKNKEKGPRSKDLRLFSWLRRLDSNQQPRS
jgi:hypothetical protein